MRWTCSNTMLISVKCDIPVVIGAAWLVCSASILLAIQLYVRLVFCGDITIWIVVFVFFSFFHFAMETEHWLPCRCLHVYVRACQLWDKCAFVMFLICIFFFRFVFSHSLQCLKLALAYNLMFNQNKISMFWNEVDIIVLAKHEWERIIPREKKKEWRILKLNRFLLVFLLLSLFCVYVFFSIRLFFYRIDKY